MTLWKGLAEEIFQDQWHIIQSFNGEVPAKKQWASAAGQWSPREVGRDEGTLRPTDVIKAAGLQCEGLVTGRTFLLWRAGRHAFELLRP